MQHLNGLTTVIALTAALVSSAAVANIGQAVIAGQRLSPP
jgi:hypothetical protein